MLNAPGAFSWVELPLWIDIPFKAAQKCFSGRRGMGGPIDLGMEHVCCNSGQGRTLLRS